MTISASSVIELVTTAEGGGASEGTLHQRIADLEAQLRDANETLEAISSGEVDALIVGEAGAPQVYTLESADRPYRLLIEQMSEGAITLSLDGTTLYCNGALARMMGCSTQTLIGAPFAPHFVGATRPDFRLLTRGGKVEAELVSAGGSNFPVQLSLSPLDNDGETVLCGVVTDLSEARAQATERAQAQAERLAALERRLSEERLRFALEAGKLGSWSLDVSSMELVASDICRSIYGREAHHSFTYADLRELIHLDDRDRMAEAVSRSFDSGEDYNITYRITPGDGVRCVQVSGRPVFGEDGTPLHMSGVSLDVTERFEAEAALRDFSQSLEARVLERTCELAEVNVRLQAEMAERQRSEDALRQSQKMEAVGQLTGGVAHDFNNLLTIIRSSVDFLRRADVPEVRRLRYVDAISQTVDRAAKLTGQLLAFARRQALTPSVFDVGRQVWSVADLVRPLVGGRIEVVVDVAAEPCYAETDVSQFETALVNLAVNARDAMDGEGRLSFRVEPATDVPAVRGHAGAHGDFVLITVSDTGCGIEPDAIASIFEPFYTTKEVGKGTGLGLSQVFGFAKQSGGEINVETAPAAGAVFRLYLPRANAAVAPRPAAPAFTPGEPTRPMCILVVEDNDAVGEFAVEMLCDLGHTPVRAANAQEALMLLTADAGRFDAVFSDVVMPGMNGLQMAQVIRERFGDLPVLLTSGYSSVLAQGGADGFELLHKPYSVQALEKRLNQVTRLQGRQDYFESLPRA